MLILTRKPGESLYIGDHIKITIVELKGHQIRVGIDAPKDMRIYREEIYLQIMEENKKAAEAPLSPEIGLETLTQAWNERHVVKAPAMAGGNGSDDESNEKPRSPGLAAFSTLRVRERGGEKAPERTSSSETTKDPQIVVRRKRSKSDND